MNDIVRERRYCDCKYYDDCLDGAAKASIGKMDLFFDCGWCMRYRPEKIRYTEQDIAGSWNLLATLYLTDKGENKIN
jgi:hypothetical protein